MLRTVASLSVLAVFVFMAPLRADEKPLPINVQQFNALKQLAGDWVQVSKDGKPTGKVVSAWRVRSGGSAIEEILFPGSDHEMVTMYHLNGKELILTHYCSLGNQPRLRAEPSPDVHHIAFKFMDGTNLKSNNEAHINGVTFTIAGKNRFQATWEACKDGKACHHEVFDLVRKAK